MPNLSKCYFPVSCPFSASRRLQQGFALSWACCIRLAATIPRPNLSHIQPNPASQKPEPTSLHGTQHKNRGSPEHNLIRVCCPQAVACSEALNVYRVALVCSGHQHGTQPTQKNIKWQHDLLSRVSFFCSLLLFPSVSQFADFCRDEGSPGRIAAKHPGFNHFLSYVGATP